MSTPYSTHLAYSSHTAYGAPVPTVIPTPPVIRTLADVIAGPHRPAARLSALDSGGTVLASWDGESAILESATVSYDRTRATRRSGEATLADPRGTLSPQRPGDHFFPGGRFQLERGAWIGAMRAYDVVATLVVTGYDAAMTGHLAIRGDDPLSLLAQPFGDVVSIEAGTPVADALRTLWEPVLGDGTDWDLDDGGQTCPLRVFMEDDERLGAVIDFLNGLGLEAFSDRYGSPVLQPIPDPSTSTATAVRGFTMGADGTLLELTRSGDARPYNRVVVVVESPDGAAVVRTEVLITDPASPIHPDAIGIQTAPIARLTAGGQAEANAYARSLLVQYSLLIGDTVSGTAIPDHAIEAGDVVTFDESVSGASDRYIVDQVQHPVTTGPMSITATRVLPVFASGET